MVAVHEQHEWEGPGRRGRSGSARRPRARPCRRSPMGWKTWFPSLYTARVTAYGPPAAGSGKLPRRRCSPVDGPPPRSASAAPVSTVTVEVSTAGSVVIAVTRRPVVPGMPKRDGPPSGGDHVSHVSRREPTLDGHAVQVVRQGRVPGDELRRQAESLDGEAARHAGRRCRVRGGPPSRRPAAERRPTPQRLGWWAGAAGARQRDRDDERQGGRQQDDRADQPAHATAPLLEDAHRSPGCVRMLPVHDAPGEAGVPATAWVRPTSRGGTPTTRFAAPPMAAPSAAPPRTSRGACAPRYRRANATSAAIAPGTNRHRPCRYGVITHASPVTSTTWPETNDWPLVGVPPRTIASAIEVPGRGSDDERPDHAFGGELRGRHEERCEREPVAAQDERHERHDRADHEDAQVLRSPHQRRERLRQPVHRVERACLERADLAAARDQAARKEDRQSREDRDDVAGAPLPRRRLPSPRSASPPRRPWPSLERAETRRARSARRRPRGARPPRARRARPRCPAVRSRAASCRAAWGRR